MADLMTGSVNYDKLESKYANFIVPAIKLKVNGIDVVKPNGLLVIEMEVRLSLELAGSVTIRMANLYDEKSHSFPSSVKALFLPGTIVSVEMGYLSTTETVFKGYVDMLGVEMGERELLVVTLMDVKRLMMISGKKSLLYQVKNYSDAFKQVMGSYSLVCSTKVDSTSDNLEQPIAQNCTDYEFVERELIGQGRANREFIVVAGVAYFRKPGKVTSPIMKLRYGRELLELTAFHCYRDMKIQVIGADAMQKQVTGQATVKGNISQKRLMASTPVYTVADAGADTKDKATTKAEVIAQRQEEKSTIGQGRTIGLPEIVPGRYVEVENLDSYFDKAYYITEVTHRFAHDVYETQFEIGGCK